MTERIRYGGDYNPEQWPEQVWLEDVRLMQEARVDLVSLGVFSWSRLEPAEGEYDTAWLDRVLEVLHDGGIGVNLATATASPPSWAIRRYPQMLPVTEDGVVLHPGSRQHYAPSSPDYRRLAASLAQHLAERYRDHPAVRMWHVNNEYGCHVHADYSENAAVAFRSWLRAKYGRVDALNEAWGTDFWSQRLGSFDEVLPPRRAPYSRNPAGLLDFRRFTSDALLALYTMERDIIRAAGATQPITTNFMGPFAPLDYWRWAEEVDVVADDCYPDPRDPESFREAAFARDLMRSLKPGTPWMLMEQASNAVNWRPNNAWKAPGQMRALSEQAVARGADAIMFFQWRQSRSGSEKFHSAMVPHAGTGTRTWREVAELGEELAGREPSVPPRAAVAIVFDWQNWWAIDQPDHPVELDYLAAVRRWYDVLHRRHVQVELVRPGADLAGFSLVIAPMLAMVTEPAAERFHEFVRRGGTLVTTPFCDVVDEFNAFRPGGFSTQLAGLFGGAPVDFAGVEETDDVQVRWDASSFRGEVLREDFQVADGDVLAATSDGMPAVVRHRVGDGASFHLTVFPDAVGIDAVLDDALRESAVRPVLIDLPGHVEAIRTSAGATVINHSTQPVVLPGGERLAAFDVRHLAVGQDGSR